MRWTIQTTCVLAVLAIVGSAHGQSLKESRFTDPATLIQNKAVQKHLDLDEATVQKVFNIPILIRQGALADFKALAEVKDPVEHERRKQELKRRTMKAGIDELAKILSPGDLKRLKQIALQMGDFQVFTLPEVKAELKLSDEQQGRIKDVVDAGNKELRNVIADANVGPGDMVAMWRVSKPTRNRTMLGVVALLTADQRARWHEMVGEEFNFNLERPGKDQLPRAGGPPPATEAEKSDRNWVAQRITEWMPKPTEKSFDQIAWITELREASRLAKQHKRGLFIMVVDGVAGSGRC